MRTIQEIKSGMKSKNQDEWVTFDEIDWVIKQAEKADRWESFAIRSIREAELFERKFISYRNKMLDIFDRLEERNELPDLQDEIRRFLQDDQGDIEF